MTAYRVGEASSYLVVYFERLLVSPFPFNSFYSSLPPSDHIIAENYSQQIDQVIASPVLMLF